MKTLKINTKKWLGALAIIPALVLFSACEPQDDDPMVTDPEDESETEWGQRDRETDPAQDPAQEQPTDPSQPAEDPAMEQQDSQQEDEPAY